MAGRIAFIALFLLSLVGCQQSAEQSVEQVAEQATEQVAEHPLAAFRERNDEPITAAADRYQRRLSADGTIPPRALLRAKEQRDAMMTAHQFGAGVWPNSWTWAGPGNIGGRLRPIVIHPTNPDIIYVGSASGGIWKTTNGGTSWFPLDDFMASLSVGDMVMHPADPNTLYAGTGEGFFEAPEGSSNTAAVRGAGIFVSTDAGATWNQMPSTDNADFYFVNRIEFDPTDSNTMLVATTSGIWRTTNGGTTWNLQQAFDALDVKFDPNDPTKVVAGGHDTLLGPYYSTDRGVTWQVANGAGGHRQEIAWAPSQANTVYAAVSDNGRIKIWRSLDGGQNYTLQTSGNGIQTWASYNNTVWVDPNNADFMILGGVNLFRSNDGGVNFAQRFSSVHADMHRIVEHPDFDGVNNKTVYFATDGGIYRTADVYGTSATDLNNNLGVTQFYGAGINPTTGNIIGGTQDNGTLFYNGDPQNWDHIFGGDGGYGGADPTDPNYFYGEVQRARIHRSSNGGASSSYIYSGPNPIGDAGSSTRTNFIPFFVLDPNNPNTMLVACERMWRSTNVKASQPDWFSIKNSIQPPGGFSAGKSRQKPPRSHFNPNSWYNIATISVADGNSNIIWAAHNNGDLYYTTNGANASPTWTQVDNNGVGLPDRWISTIVIDPNDHNHVYVALMGWEADNLWETTDNGTTWTDISGSLPSAPISALAAHRVRPGWLYVGTDIGVFTSGNNGQTWSTKTDGPGTVPVEQLLWKDDNNLMAVTHGRGIFLAEIQQPVVPLSINMIIGSINSGGIPELIDSDDQHVVMDPQFTTARYQLIFEVESVLPTDTPSILEFNYEARTFNLVGQVEQKIELYDFDAGMYVQVDEQNSPSTDLTVIIMPSGDPTRFVENGVGTVRARISYQNGLPWWVVRTANLYLPFRTRVDQTTWMILP